MSKATPKLDVYEDDAGEYRWRLTATNGNIVADSGEGYKRRARAKQAALRLAKTAGMAVLVS